MRQLSLTTLLVLSVIHVTSCAPRRKDGERSAKQPVESPETGDDSKDKDENGSRPTDDTGDSPLPSQTVGPVPPHPIVSGQCTATTFQGQVSCIDADLALTESALAAINTPSWAQAAKNAANGLRPVKLVNLKARDPSTQSGLVLACSDTALMHSQLARISLSTRMDSSADGVKLRERVASTAKIANGLYLWLKCNVN